MRFQPTLVFLSAGAFVQATFGGPDAPPGSELKELIMNGSGCAKDSRASWNTTADGGLQYVTPDLKAVSGKDVPRSDGRKYCQTSISVGYPDGWQFAIKKVGVNGYEDLIAGVSGTAGGLHFFSGKGDDKSFGVNLVGEMHSGYTTTYDAPQDVSWSTCGGKNEILNVKVESRFEKGSASTLSSILIDRFKVQVQWRKC